MGRVNFQGDRSEGEKRRNTPLLAAGIVVFQVTAIFIREAVFAETVKTVVVWKLDRLARSMKEGINVLSSLCESGVRVVSVTQQIDLSGTVGQMVAGVLFGIAQIEHQHIKERQAAGIAVAKEKGIYTGRKKGTTKAKPERAKILKEQRLTHAEIAQALNINIRTVGNYLKQK